MDYKTTAKVFETTYANVFNWVKKHRKKGEDGLSDKCGCHKTDEEADGTEKWRHELKKTYQIYRLCVEYSNDYKWLYHKKSATDEENEDIALSERTTI